VLFFPVTFFYIPSAVAQPAEQVNGNNYSNTKKTVDLAFSTGLITPLKRRKKKKKAFRGGRLPLPHF
jgi:hypothetical protein